MKLHSAGGGYFDSCEFITTLTTSFFLFRKPKALFAQNTIMDIVKIESALRSINDATFQRLCDRFLWMKLYPDTFCATGTVIAKDKTKRGTPDTFFIDKDGLYIMAEYTTQRREDNPKAFLSKVEDDINKCFDETKTGIQNSLIREVIYCHTSTLPPNEIQHLEKLCKQRNSDCKFRQYGINQLAIELQRYPLILSSFLNIPCDQLFFYPNEFIGLFENRALHMPTPLTTIFHGRENELANGKSYIENEGDILILTGTAGVGKTKFALELCNRLCAADPSFEFLCASNLISSVSSDTSFLEYDKNYLLLIDDANRLGNITAIIKSIISQTRSGKIKIIATVRDYALSQIQEILIDYKYEILSIYQLESSEIKAILRREPLCIREEKILDKIVTISSNNTRLAIMCARIYQEEGNIDALNNVAEIYDQYFKEAYDTITKEDKQNTLKSLGILAFFRAIRHGYDEDRIVEFNKNLFESFNLDQSTFWTVCEHLHKCEVVDMYDHEIVRISDQSLATYLFYKSFFDEKCLSFETLIDKYIDNNYKVQDAIYPIIDAFKTRNVKDFVTNTITSYWEQNHNNFDHETTIDILSKYHDFIPSQTIAYLSQYIKSQPTIDSSDDDFSYDEKNNAYDLFHKYPELQILVWFINQQHEYAEYALELMFEFTLKRPSACPKLLQLLKECPDRTSEENGSDDFYQINNVIVDHLYQNIQTADRNNIFSTIFIKLCPRLLKLRYIYHPIYDKQNEIKQYAYEPFENDAVHTLFRKCWEQLDLLGHTDRFPFYKILAETRDKNVDCHTNILIEESKTLLPIIRDLDFAEYEACIVTNMYLDLLDKHGVKYESTLRSNASNDTYELLYKLGVNKKCKYEEREVILKSKVKAYCSALYDEERYYRLLQQLETIKDCKIKQNYHLDWVPTLVIEESLNNGPDFFLRLLSDALKSMNKIFYVRLFNRFFHAFPEHHKDLFDCLCNIGNNYYLLDYHIWIPDEIVNSIDAKDDYLIKNLLEIVQSGIVASHLHVIIEKYAHFTTKEKLYNDVIANIVCDKLIPGTEISRDFLEASIKYTSLAVNKWELVYLHQKEQNSEWDRDNEFLDFILCKDCEFIKEYLRIIPLDRHFGTDSLRAYELSFIWENDNWKSIAYEILHFCQSYMHKFGGEYNNQLALELIFFNNLLTTNDKAQEFIKEVIKLYNTDKKIMCILFKVISKQALSMIPVSVAFFVYFNTDIILFKELRLEPGSRLIYGSLISCFKDDIERYLDLKNKIINLKYGLKTLEHITYLDNKISSLQQSIENVKRREIIESYYK